MFILDLGVVGEMRAKWPREWYETSGRPFRLVALVGLKGKVKRIERENRERMECDQNLPDRATTCSSRSPISTS